MYSVSETSGRVSISLTAIFMGNDLNISLYGGNRPHIGAVALAQKRTKRFKEQTAKASR